MKRPFDSNSRLRKLCLVKIGVACYPRNVLSRFSRNVGENCLTRIMDEKVVDSKSKPAGNVEAILELPSSRLGADVTQLTAKGSSDADGRVVRACKLFSLAWKLHLSIYSKSMLPLANAFDAVSENEKEHSLSLLGEDEADSEAV